MPQFCIFGSHEHELSPQPTTYLTVFGGADLTRPPAVARVARLKASAAGAVPKPNGQYGFVTVFGGTSLRWPTLAEEFIALRDALHSGTVSLADWDRTIGHIDTDTGFRLSTFTLFGGFEGDELPSEEKELDAISLQQHLGHIPESAAEILMLAIGQHGAPRLAAVRRAVATT